MQMEDALEDQEPPANQALASAAQGHLPVREQQVDELPVPLSSGDALL